MSDHKELVLPCEIYGVALLSLSALTFVHLDYLASHPYLTTREFTPEILGMLKHRILLFTAIPVASMIVAFYSTHLAVYMYLGLVLAHFLSSRVEERIHTSPADDAGPDER